MKDFLTIFRFEFFSKMKQKSIQVTTIIMLAIVFIIACVPSIITLFNKEEAPGNITGDTQVVEALDTSQEMGERWGYVNNQQVLIQEDIEGIYPFSIAAAYPDEQALAEAIENEELDRGLVATAPNHIQLVAKDLSMYDFSQQTIESAVNAYFFNKNLQSVGIDPQVVEQARNTAFTFDTLNLGKNATTGYIFAMVGMLMVYMLVLLYGAGVATTVAREKNDRTMEILITNTKADNLIWGKVVANVCLSLGQLILILLVGAVGIYLNRSNYPMAIMGVIIQSLTPSVLAVFVGFTLMGTFLYYFLYAALGALVSKVEEVGNATAPIQFIFIGAYMLCMTGMQMPGSALMRVISIIPFSSPMAMFVRYTMATVPTFDLVLAVVLMVITIWVMAKIAIKIYRLGTLNYGNRMSFTKAIKMAFAKENA